MILTDCPPIYITMCVEESVANARSRHLLIYSIDYDRDSRVMNYRLEDDGTTL